METKEPLCSVPDTFGLPEFFITEIFTEIAGANVRLICGVRRGGEVHWLYSAVIPAENLMIAAQQCSKAALEAFGVCQVLERQPAH